MRCEKCGEVYPSKYYFKDEGMTTRLLCTKCSNSMTADEIESFMREPKSEVLKPNEVKSETPMRTEVESALASSGRRFLNFVIDLILSRIVIILLLTPFADTEFVEDLADNRLADWLFTLSMIFLYYFIFETAFQRTPAKLLTSTKVVLLDGSKPDAGTIAIRTLSRFVPFEPLSGSANTWWHDRWTKTRVIKA